MTGVNYPDTQTAKSVPMGLAAIVCLVFLMTSAFVQAKISHDEYDQILKANVENGLVNYAELKKNRVLLDSYLNQLAQVDKKDFATWSREVQLAYLINLYNAATLQLVIAHYPIQSIKDIGNFFIGPWDMPLIGLFGSKISLKTLEHDIIRKEFREPRVHMALVCAAKGCPHLRAEAYVAERLDTQLDDQSKKYLSSPHGMRIVLEERQVYLSSIFKWYAADFPSVSAFVEHHADLKFDGFSLRWLEYDWSLNQQ